MKLPNHAAGLLLLKELRGTCDLQAIFVKKTGETIGQQYTKADAIQLAKMADTASEHVGVIVGIRETAWRDGLDQTISDICELQLALLIQVVLIKTNGSMETKF